MTLVDDADRHQQHAGADVEAARQQEVHVRLFQFELAGFFEAFDQGVFELDLAHEADAIAELVRDEQDEAVEVEAAVLLFDLVEMEVHVARDVRGALGGRGRSRRRLRVCAPGRDGQRGEHRKGKGDGQSERRAHGCKM